MESFFKKVLYIQLGILAMLLPFAFGSAPLVVCLITKNPNWLLLLFITVPTAAATYALIFRD